MVSEKFTPELNRIESAYGRRRSGQLYSFFNAAHLLILQEREHQVITVLKKAKLNHNEFCQKKILEIGCGTGFWIRDFIQWGARPEHITGVDLLGDRIAAARELCPAGVTLVCGNAGKLDFPRDSFDLVLQSTLFTSILDDSLKKEIAAEMVRVLRPDGLILWYDYHVSNPWNPDVQGVKKAEIHTLFPGCSIKLHRVTLAPPLSRLLAPHSHLLVHLLEKIPFLCTHYLGVIRKEAMEMPPFLDHFK